MCNDLFNICFSQQDWHCSTLRLSESNNLILILKEKLKEEKRWRREEAVAQREKSESNKWLVLVKQPKFRILLYSWKFGSYPTPNMVSLQKFVTVSRKLLLAQLFTKRLFFFCLLCFDRHTIEMGVIRHADMVLLAHQHSRLSLKDKCNGFFMVLLNSRKECVTQ